MINNSKLLQVRGKKMHVFLAPLLKNHLSVDSWIYVCILYSIPLVHVSILCQLHVVLVIKGLCLCYFCSRLLRLFVIYPYFLSDYVGSISNLLGFFPVPLLSALSCGIIAFTHSNKSYTLLILVSHTLLSVWPFQNTILVLLLLKKS
jgi:branched-subunit amino acid transport protein